MTRVLFVSNGHGEAAIADRIAADTRAMLPNAALDHLALVGEPDSNAMEAVGPRRAMPSGGLVAMGNVRNLARDVRGGLLPLVLNQRSFLRAARGTYAAAVAVGDTYALMMTLRARAPTVFVGTAKSISVARYGSFEARVLARADACFVRDDATAVALRAHGVKAQAANVIVDLYATSGDAAVHPAVRGFSPALAMLPGSRAEAYADASFLLEVLERVHDRVPQAGALLSVAAGLDASRFAAEAAAAGWEVVDEGLASVPFSLRRRGRITVRAWLGPLGPVFAQVAMVLGQAGTANEGAAAAGVPVVAFARERDGKSRWYRRRQQALLGDALAVLPGEAAEAAIGVCALLDDSARRQRMSEVGRARMGAPGGARRIAECIATLASEHPCDV